MIFAVAGTQLAFPRLMTALDNVAARHGLEVVAQTADPAFVAQTMTAIPFMMPDEFAAHVARCTVMVAHAGLGAIIAAGENRKPLILMPRDASLGEHRNDHQRDTVRRFEGAEGLRVVTTELELENAICSTPLADFGAAAPERRQTLIDALRLSIG